MYDPRQLPVPQIFPGGNVEPHLDSFNASERTSSEKIPDLGDDFDTPEDEILCVPSFDHDAAQMVDQYPAETPLNPEIMSIILEDQQPLRFDCLGDMPPGPSVPVATVHHRVIQTCCAKFLLMMNAQSGIRAKRIFMDSFFESRILLLRFVALYRAFRQNKFPESRFQAQMIDGLFGPGLINPMCTCYINAFVQILLHILPLKFMMIAWPIPDAIVSKLRLLFVAMSQGRITGTVSLSTVYEPHVHGSKDCAELALQILGALRDSSSWILRCKIEELVFST
jgi:hypothetical protein